MSEQPSKAVGGWGEWFTRATSGKGATRGPSAPSAPSAMSQGVLEVLQDLYSQEGTVLRDELESEVNRQVYDQLKKSTDTSGLSWPMSSKLTYEDVRLATGSRSLGLSKGALGDSAHQRADQSLQRRDADLGSLLGRHNGLLTALAYAHGSVDYDAALQARFQALRDDATRRAWVDELYTTVKCTLKRCST